MSAVGSAADEQTPTILQRAECLGGRNSSAQVVEVARIFRLGQVLHLEQIGVMELAAIETDRALPEDGVFGRHLLHLSHDRRPHLREGHDPSRWPDRKSTRLNSSHLGISYAVLCLKKKK